MKKQMGFYCFVVAADCKEQFQEYLKGMLSGFIYILGFYGFYPAAVHLMILKPIPEISQ